MNLKNTLNPRIQRKVYQEPRIRQTVPSGMTVHQYHPSYCLRGDVGKRQNIDTQLRRTDHGLPDLNVRPRPGTVPLEIVSHERGETNT